MKLCKSLYMTDTQTIGLTTNETWPNTEQLEFLSFILSEFEYNDDKERTLIEQIEAKVYDVREEDIFRVMNILKAQAKQPNMEW